MASPSVTPMRKSLKNYNYNNAERSPKNTALVGKASKSSSNYSNVTLSKDVQRSAIASLTKLKSRLENKGMASNSSSLVSKRKKAPKAFEPIRLPEDILTIQAHCASTPVTELPYLLIAAHIGALPTTRQFYPTTSATNSPLTVFRDMFVMTIDVRGYKPSSVRLSTEGHLVIIECLQSEVPQVVFTQTGVVDSNDQCIVDASPNLNAMPVHTSFNYVQHRVKLPEDFSEEGLKVGLDDVSGHVIITGRLVHNQQTDFPEAWAKNRVVRKPRGPIVNTVSSASLNQEDARKLAAWNAVQGKPGVGGGKNDEIINTNLIGYGRKQWLEREGSKLRSIQHKALKENIRKLTELKHSLSRKHSLADTKRALSNNTPFSKYSGGTNVDTSLAAQNVNSSSSFKNPSAGAGAATPFGEGTEASKSISALSLDAKSSKESRHKVSFPPGLKTPQGKQRKKKHRDENVSKGSLSRKSLNKLDQPQKRSKGKEEGKKKRKKGSKHEDSEDNQINGDVTAETDATMTKNDSNDGKDNSSMEVEVSSPSSGVDSHTLIRQLSQTIQDSIKVGSSPSHSGSATPRSPASHSPKSGIYDDSPSPTADASGASDSPLKSMSPRNAPQSPSKSMSQRNNSQSPSKSLSPRNASSVTKIKERKQSRSSSKAGTSNVSKVNSQTDASGSAKTAQIELENIDDIISRSLADKGKTIDDADDPIGKQDKVMWEELLSQAGVGKPKPARD